MAERTRSALLVIDVQNDVVVDAHNRQEVVATINDLVQRARREEVPVIWIQHQDGDLPPRTDGWQIVPELDPQPSEPVIAKSHRDAFEATSLGAELETLAVERLVVTGAQTDYCVRWTLHGALNGGYDTVLVADGHTTDESSSPGMPSGAQTIAHTNSVWATQTHPTAAASVVTAATLTF